MICLGECQPLSLDEIRMTKILSTLLLFIFSWLTPLPLLAAPEVIIGYANISARVSPLWIAQEKGFFGKYGVAVQPVYMPGSPVMIASLSTGQIQLANSGGTAALGAAAGGLAPSPAVFPSTWSSSPPLRVPKIFASRRPGHWWNHLDGGDARARTLGAGSAA
jgi:ABC-type nitrate/sulfonate/bicarbonate transport system substrate-binding protein